MKKPANDKQNKDAGGKQTKEEMPKSSMMKKPANEKQNVDAGGKQTKEEIPKKRKRTEDQKEDACTGFTWRKKWKCRAWWPDPQVASLERLWVLQDLQRNEEEIEERWLSTSATRPK